MHPHMIILSLVSTFVLTNGMTLQPRADPKLNEYPAQNCLNTDGSNTPTWHHSQLCGCVTIDTSTVSVYLATSPGQNMHAFTTQDCNPGTTGANSLGSIGGGCHEVTTQFNAGPMGSVQFWVPGFCDLAQLGEDLADDVKAVLTDIITGAAASG